MCVCVEPCKVHARTIDSRAKEREREYAQYAWKGVSRVTGIYIALVKVKCDAGGDNYLAIIERSGCLYKINFRK